MPALGRRGALVVAGGLLVGALAACGGGSEASGGGPGAGSTAPSSTGLPTSSATPSDGPTSASPTAEPTELGELVEMQGGTFRLPEGFRTTQQSKVLVIARRRIGNDLAYLTVITQHNAGVKDTFAENIRRHNAIEIPYFRDPRTLAPITADGLPMFHVAGKVNPHQWGEAFGGDTDEFYVQVDFLVDLPIHVEAREEMVADFLDSLTIVQ